MCCPIQEPVYWYNITPRDDVSPSTAPAYKIYQYEVGVKRVNRAIASPGPKHSSYQVGECVCVKVTQSQCTIKFGRGEVTKISSPQSILVDGIPRHVKDLHPVSSHWRKTLTAQRFLKEEQRVCCWMMEKILSQTVHPLKKRKQDPPFLPLHRSTR